ncbi:hypothetical protein [Alteribacillus sp. YIM 98480]|uniref:hypothetical protein n=1 Tax=Alteribacillus sp. YIM 98480 TaxID=2606599 RepID=UPI001E554C5F|nr:hypothetical protein [Alteribacillus sp. YIM 98480]
MSQDVTLGAELPSFRALALFLWTCACKYDPQAKLIVNNRSRSKLNNEEQELQSGSIRFIIEEIQ